MKKIPLILMALSTLMLVACEEETIITNLGEGSTGVDETTPLKNLLVNDVSGNIYLNYWKCDDPAFPGKVTEMVFFEDNSALIGDANDLEQLTYTESDSSVDLFYNGSRIARYSNFIVATSQQSYDLSYSTVDGTTGTLSCQLAGDLSAQQQIFDADVFANYQDETDTGEAWGCFLSNETQMVFGLGANGFGAFSNETYLDGVALSWSADAQGLYITLGDGSQIIASNPRLESGNLVADRVFIDGVNAGSMQCQVLLVNV